MTVRMIQQKRQQHQRDTSATNENREEMSEPVTFRGTANEVTARFFGRPTGETDLERGDALWAERYGRSGTGTGVQRTAEAGETDTDLPRYGEFYLLTIMLFAGVLWSDDTGDNRGTTAIKAPERAYNPSAPPRPDHIESQTTTNETSRDAPPQYDRAISTPAITGPPVVTTL